MTRTTLRTTPLTTFPCCSEPRIRFNWGYRDGAHNQRLGFRYIPHGESGEGTDQFWAAGFRAGWNDARHGKDTETSCNDAWDDARAWGDVPR